MIESMQHPDAPGTFGSNVTANDPRIQRVAPLDGPLPLEELGTPLPVETPETPAPALAPEAPVTPAELPEQIYSWQPTDEHDRPMGGKQVIKYRTQEEFQKKMTEINVNLQRELRKVSRKQRLGIVDAVTLPTDVEKAPAALTFERKPLTAEERFELTQQLANPETCEAARDRLLESAGYTDMQKTVAELNERVRQNDAYVNFQIFVNQTPEFYAHQENVELLCDWVIKNGLNPTTRNFALAYSTAKEAGLLLEPPIVREDTPAAVVEPQPVAVVEAAPVVPENTVPESQAPVAEAARIDEPVQPQPKSQARVPSGLNSRVASNTGVDVPTTEKPAFTLAQINRMSSDEYKRRLMTMPGFSKLVETLEKEAAEKRQQQPR
jgi:hypothetical protein